MLAGTDAEELALSGVSSLKMALCGSGAVSKLVSV